MSMKCNLGGRLIKDIFLQDNGLNWSWVSEYDFDIEGELLEPVNSLWYLGLEVVPYRIVTHATNTLKDKPKNALNPLLAP